MIASDEGVVVGESEEVGKGLSHEDEENSSASFHTSNPHVMQ